MILKILGSSSNGNCYLLQSGSHSLMIECGFNYRDIQKFLNFKISDVSCIISHRDSDHSKALKGLLCRGINVFSSKDVFDSFGVGENINAHIIESGKMFKIGDFKVIPFTVFHDKPTLGFYINHPECGNVLFATDTTHIEGKFNNLNNIIIEANYSEYIMQKLEERGNGYAYVSDRIRNSHMSIETCYEFLAHQDLSAVNNIVLIHLSDRNSDSNAFRERITNLTGKTVTIADSGTEIQFNKTPF